MSEYSVPPEAIVPPGEEYLPYGEEFDSPIAEYPPVPSTPLSVEYLSELPIDEAAPRKKKKRSSFHKFAVAVLGATVLGVSVSLSGTKAEAVITTTVAAIAETPSPVSYAAESLLTEDSMPAVTVAPSPAPDPYAGLTDADILLRQKTWEGDGITVTFLQNGGGYWTAGSDNGILSWSENADGTVNYTGTAMLYNYDSSASSADGARYVYTEGTPVYYIETVTCSGTVELNRVSMRIAMENPLADPCRVYRGSASAVDNPVSFGESSPGDPLLIRATAEISLLEGKWLTAEGESGSVGALTVSAGGSGTVTLLGQEIAVTAEAEPGEGFRYLLRGTDGAISVKKGNATVSFDAVKAVLTLRDGRPRLMVLDMLSDGLPVYRALVQAES